jgi:hypothetical protein
VTGPPSSSEGGSLLPYDGLQAFVIASFTRKERGDIVPNAIHTSYIRATTSNLEVRIDKNDGRLCIERGNTAVNVRCSVRTTYLAIVGSGACGGHAYEYAVLGASNTPHLEEEDFPYLLLLELD